MAATLEDIIVARAVDRISVNNKEKTFQPHLGNRKVFDEAD